MLIINKEDNQLKLIKIFIYKYQIYCELITEYLYIKVYG